MYFAAGVRAIWNLLCSINISVICVLSPVFKIHVQLVVILRTSEWKCRRKQRETHSLSADLNWSCLQTFSLHHTSQMRPSFWLSSGDSVMESPCSNLDTSLMHSFWFCISNNPFHLFQWPLCTFYYIILDLVLTYRFLYSALLLLEYTSIIRILLLNWCFLSSWDRPLKILLSHLCDLKSISEEY